MRRYRLKCATFNVIREANEPSPRILNDPAAVARLAIDLAREHDDDRERFWGIYTDAKYRYRFHTLVSIGSQNGSLVHPREVFGPAVREGAVALIVVHNHPSGDPEPSREDRDVTRRLVKSGELLGITLLDHVILGNGTERWVSMRERGMMT